MSITKPERGIACPTCGVKAGIPCERESGETMWGVYHRTRRDAVELIINEQARRADLYPEMLARLKEIDKYLSGTCTLSRSDLKALIAKCEGPNDKPKD